jgi:hypothetical protein
MTLPSTLPHALLSKNELFIKRVRPAVRTQKNGREIASTAV